MHVPVIVIAVALVLATVSVAAQAPPPAGEIKGTAWLHTTDSLAATVSQADVCLPPVATGGTRFFGKFKDIPKLQGARVPVVLFLHGSSGLGLKAIGEWQQWLCGLGYASIAPDSFALEGHVTYKSPIDKDSYERIHALRASEITPTLSALKSQTWVDLGRMVLAGTSEGAVPVARYSGSEFTARIMFAWSCENNYFVKSALNSFETNKPVLNIISALASPLPRPSRQSACGRSPPLISWPAASPGSCPAPAWRAAWAWGPCTRSGRSNRPLRGG